MKSWKFSALVVVISIISIFSPTKSIALNIKPGYSCSVIGQTAVYKGIKYQCQSFGKKKVWAIAPKVIPSPIPTPNIEGPDSNKPSPSPTNFKTSPSPTNPPVNLKYQPKIGDCFSYSYEQAAYKNVDDNPVNCLYSHTAETYKVEKWVSNVNVYADTDSNIYAVVAPICKPINYKSESAFNSFIFSFPTQTQWESGERWIRCDAVILDSTTKPTKLLPWYGEPPLKQVLPATCTVESAKAKSWNYGDSRSSSFGFLIRNSSTDRDATQIVITLNITFTDGEQSKELLEVSRIPAGQIVGVGKTIDTNASINSWRYSIKCLDSAKGKNAKLIEFSGTLQRDQSNYSPMGLVYEANIVNSYADVIRCKNDGYSCLVYVLFYDSAGGMVSGDTITFTGPIYPNDNISVRGSLYNYPQSFYPERMFSFKIWIQEPQL